MKTTELRVRTAQIWHFSQGCYHSSFSSQPTSSTRVGQAVNGSLDLEHYSLERRPWWQGRARAPLAYFTGLWRASSELAD
jgi:hypothetical protein